MTNPQLDARLALLEAAVAEQIEQHRGAIQSVERYAQRCPNSAQVLVNVRAAQVPVTPAPPVTTRDLKRRYAPIFANDPPAA